MAFEKADCTQEQILMAVEATIQAWQDASEGPVRQGAVIAIMRRRGLEAHVAWWAIHYAFVRGLVRREKKPNGHVFMWPVEVEEWKDA
jgi:hypothetical protein